MAYNCYQVQMANAWKERISKEDRVAEKFWLDQARGDAGSCAGSVARGSEAPSGYTSKTSFLKSRLENLEHDLAMEKEARRRVETQLDTLRSSQSFGSQPGTPKGF